MNAEKVVFSFIVVLALTLNFGFFLGEMEDPLHHNIYELLILYIPNIMYFVDMPLLAGHRAGRCHSNFPAIILRQLRLQLPICQKL